MVQLVERRIRACVGRNVICSSRVLHDTFYRYCLPCTVWVRLLFFRKGQCECQGQWSRSIVSVDGHDEGKEVSHLTKKGQICRRSSYTSRHFARPTVTLYYRHRQWKRCVKSYFPSPVQRWCCNCPVSGKVKGADEADIFNWVQRSSETAPAPYPVSAQRQFSIYFETVLTNGKAMIRVSHLFSTCFKTFTHSSGIKSVRIGLHHIPPA